MSNDYLGALKLPALLSRQESLANQSNDYREPRESRVFAIGRSLQEDESIGCHKFSIGLER